MKNRQNSYIIIILLLFVSFGVRNGLNAQSTTTPITITQPQIVPVSPEAAAVQKYVCYPVNHSTGLANINIPIYTIKVGDIELPISLSYHSAGIKLRQLSGWVGTNWTLNAEPSIMREIRGIPDEEKYGGYLTSKYFNEREQNDPDKKTRFLKKIEKKIIDSEPDRFFYKLANQSGTFYLGIETTGFKPVTRVCAFYSRPYTPIKVIGWEMLGPNGLDIIDDNGSIYQFGSEDEGYTEKTGDYNTRWLCKKIISNQTRANISFKYTEFQTKPLLGQYPNDYVVLEDYPGYLRSGVQKPDSDRFPINENTFLTRPDSSGVRAAYSTPSGRYRLIAKQGATTSYYRIEEGEAIRTGSYSNFTEYVVPNPYFDKTVKERKLSSIHFDNGYVLFEQDAYDNLSLITVKSIDGRIIKRVQFYITRYNPNTIMTKLDSIVITSGKTASERRVYTFQYKNPYSVQPESSYAMDHWGYYNGQTDLQSGKRLFIPFGRYNVDSNGQHYFYFGDTARDCDEACMQAGVLTDIYSPEGVHTNFTYEANRYGKRFSEGGNYAKCEFLAGGLRVQRIREDEIRGGFSRTRLFFYALSKPQLGDGNFKDGLGVPKHALTERDYCTQMERLTINPQSGHTELCRIRTWGTTPVSDITFSNGSSVIYPFVRERVLFGSEEESCTEYTFSAPSWELHGGIPDDPFDPRTQVRRDITKPYDADAGWDDLLYGQLLKKEIFAGDTLRESHEYEYSIYKEPLVDKATQKVIIGRPYKTRACNMEEYNSRPQEIYRDTTWGIQPGAPRLKRERITRFSDDNKKQVQTRDYIYCPDNQYDEFDSEISIFALNATRHLNPLRIRTTNGRFKTYEYFLYPEEAKDSIKEDLGQISLLQLNAVNKLMLYKRIYNKDTTALRNVYSGLNVKEVQAWNPQLSKYEDRLRYTYTPYGNISSVTSDGFTTSYLWSYYNQHPAFKIEGMTMEEMIQKTQNDSSWISAMEKQGAPTTMALSYMKMIQELPGYRGYSYTYLPLTGVTSIKGPDGITTYYTYDSWGRLINTYILENGLKKIIATFNYNTPSY